MDGTKPSSCAEDDEDIGQRDVERGVTVSAMGVEVKEGSKVSDGKPAATLDKPEPISYFKLYSTADSLDYMLMLVGSVSAVANGATWPLFTYLFGRFTNTLGDPNSTESFTSQVASVALSFLYLAIGTAVASALEQFCWTYTGSRQTNRLRRAYMAAVLRQEISFFDVAATTGGLLQGLNEDATLVQTAMSEKVGNSLKNVTTFIGGFALAFWAAWDMALVMIGCLPFLVVVTGIVTKVLERTTTRANEAYGKANSVAQQSISQIRTVAAYGQEQLTIKEYSSQLDEPTKIGVKEAVLTGMSIGSINAIMFWTYAIAFFYGVWQVSEGRYNGGRVLTAMMSALMGGFTLGAAAPNIQHFAKGAAAGARLFFIISRQPVIDSSQADGRTLEVVKGRLELKDVHFTYPARQDVAVFRGFSLTVEAGQTVALVGSSGSGKSTVVGLVERFYDPAQGCVMLDGVDIRQLDLKWYRSQVGLVSQEPTLFATTIYENIAMGLDGATKQDVENAAKAANAHDFIALLPKGYLTHVGERGLQLSGGQKQRISIARAILKNPKVLLLDEATSALDTRSERLVQETLNKMTVGRTTVVVAHRLATVKTADVIAVLQKGNIIEMGRHEELLTKPTGAYTTLVKLQLATHTSAHHGPSFRIDSIVDHEGVILEEEAGEEEAVGGQEDKSDGLPSPKDDSAEHVKAVGGPVSKGSVGQEVVEVKSGALVSTEDNSAHAPRPGSGRGGSRHGGSSKPGSGHGHLATKTPGDDLKEDAAKEEEVGWFKRLMLKLRPDKKKTDEVEVESSFTDLIILNKPEWPWGISGAVAAAIQGCITPAFALIFSSLITLFYSNDPSYMRKRAGFYAGMFAILGAGALACSLISQYGFGYMGTQLSRRVRMMFFSAILYQEVGWFDREENQSGMLTAMLSTDATHIRGAVGDTIGLLVQNLSCVAFGFILSFAYDWRMALVVCGVLPLMAVAVVIQNNVMMGFNGGSGDTYNAAACSAQEALSSMRVITAYNLQVYMSNRFNVLIQVADKKMFKQAGAMGAAYSFSQFTLMAMYALIIWFVGQEVGSGRASFDHALKAFLAVVFAAMGLAQAQMEFPYVGKAKAAIKRIWPIMYRQPQIDAASDAGFLPPSSLVAGELELVKVTFAYPSRPNVVVFKDISLQVAPGKVLALVGESGSGKSTVVGLLERFYDPLKGQVLFDGRGVKSYRLSWLRSQFGLVSQEPLLFTGSIRDNILYGNPTATQEDLEAAAKVANAWDFVQALPEKFDTLVGEQGIQLSGGQKQRVAIARAVVRQPRVLLLDEATSALDAAAEAEVQAALDQVMVGRTSVVIAHRLSTIRHANTIAVVYRGRIVESGTHEELMDIHDGHYGRLVAAQVTQVDEPAETTARK